VSIPFVDLKTQKARLEDSVRRRMDRVLEHGQFIMGPEVHELERALAEFTGARRVVTCSSGTDALLLPLMAHGVGPGDAIFTSPFTFIATAEVIALLGATPVFVDIDPRTFNLDPNRLAAAVDRVAAEGKLQPRGIVPVDLFGLPADYEPIRALAQKHHLFLLGDAAQAMGGTYKGKQVGTLADVTATSFYPAKPLGCYGDGGAVFTDDEELADWMESIRVHGKGAGKYDSVRVGINGRLDTLQAAVLLAKLEIFADEVAARQRAADEYGRRLAQAVEVPRVPADRTSGWAQYSILTDRRAALQAALSEHEIPSVVYYPRPLHLQEAFADLGYREGDMPVAEATSQQILSLPMHPYLATEQLETIATCVQEALGSTAV
jgi:dTDP-4-amino-4,6-dideoxygalactose transaminase